MIQTISKELYDKNGFCYDLKRGKIYEYSINLDYEHNRIYTFNKIRVNGGSRTIKINKHFLFIEAKKIKVIVSGEKLSEVYTTKTLWNEDGYSKNFKKYLYKRGKSNCSFNLSDMRF